MKNNLYKALFLLLAGLAAVSCNKGSEPAPTPAPASIVGTWTYVTATTVTTAKADGAKNTGTYTYTPDGLKLTLRADGSRVEAFQGTVNSTGTYTYVGTTLTTKGGVASPGLGTVYTVTSLTDKSMVFTVTDEDVRATYFRTFNLIR